MKRQKSSVILLTFLLAATVGAEEKFLPGDPHWKDTDQLHTPAQPAEIEIGRVYDFFLQTFSDTGDKNTGPAYNINTLGEVPDSSWFTNRIGMRPMSIEEVAKGPNTGTGPDTTQPWTILSAKTEGATPGLIIEDSRGDTYFVKFDSPSTPELQSSAEVISTKFFHDIGYNVPENYVAYITREHLNIKPDGNVLKADINAILEKAYIREDGKIRTLASLKLPGEPIGPFEFKGTRSDDPNDIFQHEHRRELRGYRVFSAWLNHTDSDTSNTLDVYVEENGKKFVKHYLLDFGTTLGSGAVAPKAKRAGYEYRFEGGQVLRSAVTLGLAHRFWESIDYPDYPAVGRFEAEHFEPSEWKPDHPNPAFEKMQEDDAFWAARIISKFTDDMIRAVVKTAQISDARAEEYIADTLIKRRDKILRHYFSTINPLAEFEISGADLIFKNFGTAHDIAKANAYEYQWFLFNNEDGKKQSLGQLQKSQTEKIPVPEEQSGYVMVQIRTISSDRPEWNKPVEVYLRSASQKSVVGVERQNLPKP